MTEEHELGLMSSMVTTADGKSHAPRSYQLEQHIGTGSRQSLSRIILREQNYA